MKYTLFLLFFFLLSCGDDAFHIEHNNEINSKDKKIIRNYISLICRCIQNKNLDSIKNIYPEILKKDLNKDEYNNFFYSFYMIPTFCDSNIISEYMLTNSKESNITRLNLNTSYISFPVRKCTYILRYKTLCDKKTTWQLLCIFQKNRNENWKLSSLYLGAWLHNNKNAVDYYNIAKNKYPNDMKNALLNIEISKAISNAGGPCMHYLIQDKIDSLNNIIIHEVKANNILPFNIVEIENSPKIVDLWLRLYHHEFYPVIDVQCKANQSDTLLLKNEGYNISRYINNYARDLSTVNDKIIYAFVELVPGSTDKFNVIYSFLAK